MKEYYVEADFIPPMQKVLSALSASWGPDTAQNPVPERGPASGQCAVSSLVILSYYGGKIMTGEVSDLNIRHYWNVLPDGMVLDTTASQFEPDEQVKNVRLATDKKLRLQETSEKFTILIKRVNQKLVYDGRSQYQ